MSERRLIGHRGDDVNSEQGTLYPAVLTLILKEQVCIHTPNPAVSWHGSVWPTAD